LSYAVRIPWAYGLYVHKNRVHEEAKLFQEAFFLEVTGGFLSLFNRDL